MASFTKSELKKIYKKVNYNRLCGYEDWYKDLTFEEVHILYDFCQKGHLLQQKRFVYPDAQGTKYIRVKLVLKHYSMMSFNDAQKEYKRLQCCGFLYISTLNGEVVLCTADGIIDVKRLNKGIMFENYRPLF